MSHDLDLLDKLAQAVAPTALESVVRDDYGDRPILAVWHESVPVIGVSVMVVNDALTGPWYATSDYEVLAPVTDIAKAIDALVTLLRTLTAAAQSDGGGGR